MTIERWEEIYNALIDLRSVGHQHRRPGNGAEQDQSDADEAIIEAACKRIARLEAEKAEVVRMLDDIRGVMDESEGVAGWHRNGAVAYWHEFEFYDGMAAILAKHKEQS